MNSRYRRLYLERIMDLLNGPRREEILTRARGVIALWRKTDHMAPYYADQWQRLLNMPLDDARGLVLSDTDEGERLRHCMPFAGLLNNKERAELRRLCAA